MNTINKKFHYDELYDSLIISNKEDNEIVKENFMFDDFVISMTGSGKIVGLEIRDISRFLEESGINPEILNDINDANVIVTPKRDCVFIGLAIKSSKYNMVQRIPITHIPIPITN